MTYIIIGIILAGGLAFYLTSCKGKSNADNNTTANVDTSKVKIHKTQENAFEGLRNMAFSATPDQLALSLPTDKTVVYGVIMDWEMGGATATTVSYQTGDASLYFSSGACIIGGGQHEEIRELSKEFISLCINLTEEGRPYKDSLTTLQNTVSLYLLTTSGKFLIRDNIEDVKNGNSKLSELYLMTNDIITEFRKADEANRKRK